MGSYTEGPYSSRKNEDDFSIVISNHKGIEVLRLSPIFDNDLSDSVKLAQEEANARLACNMPNMIEVIIEQKKMLEDFKSGRFFDVDINQQIAKLDKVIRDVD